MVQTKNLIKDFRAPSSQLSANSSVTYEQIAKELNSYFEGKSLFTFGKDAEWLYLYFSDETYTQPFFTFSLHRTPIEVVNLLNDRSFQHKILQFYGYICGKKAKSESAISCSTEILSPQVTEEFISSIVKLLNAEYGNKECAFTTLKHMDYRCYIIYLYDINSGADKRLTIIPMYATEYEALKHINSEYFANILRICYKNLFNKEINKQPAKEALSAEDNLRNEVNRLLHRSGCLKHCGEDIAKACKAYFKLKGIDKWYVMFNGSVLKLSRYGEWATGCYGIDQVGFLLNAVIGLSANQQPAESDELLTLRQIAKELDSYFEGLVEVILDESKLAISLKLDKLGGFQLDDFIKWTEDKLTVVINFRGVKATLRNPFSNDHGLFGDNSFSLSFLADLKYRAQSLKA